MKTTSLCRVPFVLLCLAASGFAQSTSGSIFGTVTDASGAAIPNARIFAVERTTNLTSTAATNMVGDYVFPALPPGTYRIEVTQLGFKKFVQSGVLLELNRSVKIEISLTIGEIAERIEVSSAPQAVETREAQIGGTVDHQRGVDLPLNGRNVYDLALTLPRGLQRFRTTTVIP